MPRYKAIERGYDNVKLREVGEIFDFDGAHNLKPWAVEVDDEGNEIGDDGKPKKQAKKKPEADLK